MDQPIQLISNLFEMLRLAQGTSLVFNTGRFNEDHEKFVISFTEGIFEGKCTKLIDNASWFSVFHSAHDFVYNCLPKHVWISSILIEDNCGNQACIYYNLARTDTLV